MGICSSKDKVDYDLIQSVIFYRYKAYNKEILMWDLPRATAYMARRSWLWCSPPDLSKQNQIKLHVIQEDKFESLQYQQIGCGICIVFGTLPKPYPRRRKLLVRIPSRKNNIHSIDELKADD